MLCVCVPDLCSVCLLQLLSEVLHLLGHPLLLLLLVGVLLLQAPAHHQQNTAY